MMMMMRMMMRMRRWESAGERERERERGARRGGEREAEAGAGAERRISPSVLPPSIPPPVLRFRSSGSDPPVPILRFRSSGSRSASWTSQQQQCGASTARRTRRPPSSTTSCCTGKRPDTGTGTLTGTGTAAGIRGSVLFRPELRVFRRRRRTAARPRGVVPATGGPAELRHESAARASGGADGTGAVTSLFTRALGAFILMISHFTRACACQGA